MVRPRRTARKSTGRQPTGQLAPHDMPQPQELQHVPQEEEPIEIQLVVPGSQEPQDTPAEEQQQQQGDCDDNNEDEDDEEYSPLSDTEGEKLYRDAEEMESFGTEAPIPTGRLRALLGHLGITSAPRYRIKGVPRPGRTEFKAVAEIFSGSRIVSRHQGPAFRASTSDAVADAAWQAITSWSRRHQGKLQDSVHRLLPQRKKNRFKASGVKKDVPRMEMVHHQDMTVELSTRLLAAQREIESLRTQLRNSDATIRGYQRMVEGQASDLYASDTDTWSATSTVQGSDEESPVDSPSPSGSRSR